MSSDWDQGFEEEDHVELGSIGKMGGKFWRTVWHPVCLEFLKYWSSIEVIVSFPPSPVWVIWISPKWIFPKWFWFRYINILQIIITANKQPQNLKNNLLKFPPEKRLHKKPPNNPRCKSSSNKIITKQQNCGKCWHCGK